MTMKKDTKDTKDTKYTEDSSIEASKSAAAAKVAASRSRAVDEYAVRHFLAWAVSAHPARAQELTELLKGYIGEQEAKAAEETPDAS